MKKTTPIYIFLMVILVLTDAAAVIAGTQKENKNQEKVTSIENSTAVEEVVPKLELEPVIEKTLPAESNNIMKNQKKVTSTKKSIAVKKVVPKHQYEPATEKTLSVGTNNIKYYVQVYSFLKYPPSKSFLSSISDLGYKYKFHKVKKDSKIMTKVLVGPFEDEVVAENAQGILRSEVAPGSFFIKY